MDDSRQRAIILEEANAFLSTPPTHITAAIAPNSAGGPHDYYSSGDYWWPNPDTADGLPYVQRDGETYPRLFTAHRMALRTMRRAVTHLAVAWHITREEAYARAAAAWLRTFFLDEATRMAPHLRYAQAIPGVCDGRGIGIIDTLHLIDVPAAITLLQTQLPPEDRTGLVQWFKAYLHWMNTHENGIQEREWFNNHAVAWYAQAASFARFTGDEAMLAFCRERFKTQLLTRQMASDGSFPAELARTKPYYYASMVLDGMAMICLLASAPGDDLWTYTLPDGRGLRLGIDFLLPHLQDKTAWPYPPDIEHFDDLPVAMPYMLFAGLRCRDERLLRLYEALPQASGNEEIRRSIGIRCPTLYLLYEHGRLVSPPEA